MISIARAVRRDAERLASLHAASFARGWSTEFMDSLIASGGGIALLASDGESDVGFVLARVAADEAEILSIGVIPSARREGTAATLLQTAGQIAAGMGATRLFLEVAADNHAAIALYRRFALRQVGERPRYYAETGADGLVLQAPLPLGNADNLD